MQKMKYIFLSLMLVCLYSCVYDYPVYIPAGTKLQLAFKLNVGADEYPQMSDLSKDDYDVRYVIRAYRMTGTGSYHSAPHAEYIYTKDDITSLDSTVLVELDEGQYVFHTVVDYVPQYSVSDFHFNTMLFSDLFIRCDQYHGNTDTKTLYSGYKYVDIQRFNGESASCDTIPLAPVLAKYQIVATDVQKFYDAMITKGGDSPDFVAIHLENYKVKVRYSDTEPLYTHMNVVEGNTPTSGQTGLWFESKITKLNENEAMLCFDHVMVGDAQKITTVRVGIYKNDGTHVTTIPVKLPLQKGKFSCIKGDFLTYIGLENPEDGGVVVNPDFNGDIEINR